MEWFEWFAWVGVFVGVYLLTFVGKSEGDGDAADE
jgi:hypothetical protein